MSLIGGLGGRQRRECWGAATIDGVWAIDRLDDVGTPWQITHIPTGFIVDCWYGTLKSALEAIGSGLAMQSVDRLKAHKFSESP